MAKKKETPKTWTEAQIEKHEHALEMLVSGAARELKVLRAFRKDKVKHAAQIIPTPPSKERQP